MRTYTQERTALRKLFPRGRFQADPGDDSCLIRARTKRHRRNFLFLQAKGKLVGLYYQGLPKIYLKRLEDLIMDHINGDEDGILYLKWTPELTRLLPWFSRPAPTKTSFTPGPQRPRGRPFKKRPKQAPKPPSGHDYTI